MELLIHLGNVLILGSFLVTDILWLRMLMVAASASFIGYFAAQSPALMPPVYWNLLFTLVNVVHIYRLFMERRPVDLAPEAQALYSRAFRALSPREFDRLLGVSTWSTAASQEGIVPQGVHIDRLMAIASGRVSVRVDEREVARLGEGEFVGEMSFLTGNLTSASVAALEPTRYVTWTRSDLQGLLEDSPMLALKVQQILGADVVEKLRLQASPGDVKELARSADGGVEAS